ncbi:MAG: YggS family pyridoxal phosphate-dependent enzyme [Planctomycetes bacterium]|nr:YggS family pyridoxal phosphate-dependent enzyme [Planctomycetota bacterium]MCB9872418.1 YggS family pyridoxal phosphate-dependent enzyme [Planctomycetota bacterium]MCB9888381.1 YggS family pyridoxal phosphate-dependent enzyme [Planctomycetota bacterium]
MSVADRLAAVRAQIEAACRACGRDPEEVSLLAVTKRQSLATLAAARAAGLSAFGENRVQELSEKALAIPTGVAWHMIGSVQTNKVKALLRVPGLVLVHSLDRIELADALQRVLADGPRVLDVLLQIDATPDDTKHGLAPHAARSVLEHVQAHCPQLSVVGVMAMGPREGDPAPVFRVVADTLEELRRASGLVLPVSSLGMTGDLQPAIAAGSTLVRVGSGLFGE